MKQRRFFKNILWLSFVLLPSVCWGADTNSNGSPVVSNTPDQVASSDPCSGGSDLGASGETTDAAGQGNCAAKNAIKSASQNLTKLPITNAADINSAYQKYDKAWQSCIDAQKNAASACLENISPDLSSALGAINSILGAVSASANGSCSDFGKAMDAANKGLTAYSGACGAMKGSCGSSCGDAVKALNQLKSAASSAQCSSQTNTSCAGQLETAKQALNPAIQKEQQSSDKTSMAGKQATCNQKYAQMMGNAAAGLAGMIAGLMQGNKCADATAEAATATTVDCTDPSQSQTPTCLCAANPRLAGCALASSTGNASGTTMGSTAGNSMDSSAGTPTLSGTPSINPTATASSDPGSGVGGAAGGAGSPLGGSDGLAAAGNSGTADAAGKGLDTNVLAGVEGGGSGGGGWGSGGWSKDDNYKDYLPGGKKDPRKLAGQSGAGEITAGGARSNWEKVRDRYIDKRPSLLSTN